MEMPRLEERRHFSRLNEHIFVLCQFMEEENENIIKGFTENISAGGLMFETDRYMPCAKRFVMEIYQPQGKSQNEIISITTLAEVKWVKQTDAVDGLEGTNKFKIGMEFIKLDDEVRKIIADYVQAKLNA